MTEPVGTGGRSVAPLADRGRGRGRGRRPAHQVVGAAARSTIATSTSSGRCDSTCRSTRGMAFCRGQVSGPLIGVVALVVVVVLLLSVGRVDEPLSDGRRRPDHRRRDRATSSTACSAAPGWLRGGVVDFIDFQWFPIFNVADMAITIGGALLMLTSYIGRIAATRHAGVTERRCTVIVETRAGRARRRAARPDRRLVLDVSRSAAAALIAAGGVAVDGEPCTSASCGCSEGQEVDGRPVADAREAARRARPVGRVRRRPRRRRRDRRRQAGRARRASRRRQPDGTLVNGLLARFPDIAGVGEPHRPGIVHRLDGGTSGLLVVARTQDAADALIDAVRRRTRGSARTIALVWGHPGAPARRDRRADRPRPPRPAADGGRRRRPAGAHRVPGAASASTARPTLALLECRLETGRTHQIRVHLALDRPPARRRRRATASAARRSRSTGRSCTPPSWRSSTRSPASALDVRRAAARRPRARRSQLRRRSTRLAPASDARGVRRASRRSPRAIVGDRRPA